jgi:hypothetical protein
MAECGRGSMIAHPASDSFCSTKVNLTMPAGHMDASDLIRALPEHPCEEGAVHVWIKEGKHAVTWTRLSCHSFKANAVRLQLHALAYNLANFLRTLALPAEVAQWSMTTLRERLVKIGARIVRHGRSVIFQMAEVMVPRDLFQTILGAIAALRPLAPARC